MEENRNRLWVDGTREYYPLLTGRHPVSRRHAIFEEDGKSAWLYLTEATTLRPVSDVWVYNRIPVPHSGLINLFRDGSPPAFWGNSSHAAQCPDPETWSGELYLETFESAAWGPATEDIAPIRDMSKSLVPVR